MPDKERWGIHLYNMIDQVMAPDLILKIDQRGMKGGNEYHPLSLREWDEDKLQLGIKFSNI